MSDGSEPRPLDYESLSDGSRRRRWWLWIVLSVAVAMVILLTVSAFLPSLNRTGVVSNRVKCASNLRQIGQAILLYSNDHGGQYPDTFQTILLNEDITPEVFVCPDSNDTPASGATTQAAASQLLAGGHCSYIYCGNGFNVASVPANAVVAYEPVSDHAGDGSNVLFGDGHVEFLSANWMNQFLSKMQRRPAASTQPVTMPVD